MHEVGVTQAFPHLGVGAEGVDAAVHVHSGVVFDGATVGGGDVVIDISIGLEHFGGCTEHGCTLRVSEGA